MISASKPNARPTRATLLMGSAAGLAGAVALASGALAPSQAAPARPLPAAALDPAPATAGTQTAVLSGGCFWGVQGVFEHVRGIKKVLAGYAGGKRATAHYEMVGTGVTGHAESVEIVFDPAVISYGQILRIFFAVATDPTQVNQQYPDDGPQYRSEIFYENAGQKAVAQAYIAQLGEAKVFRHAIATRVDPDTGFFPAESYHQDYLVRHPDAAYIATYDMPKVAALKAMFPQSWRPTPNTAL